MFNLTYLSNDNKHALEKLNERLSKATIRHVRNETELTIQEIMAKAKPYQQCDLIEADELRSQILNKITILAKLGKSSEAFQGHLRDVEYHIQTLQMAEVVKEQSRPVKPDQAPNLEEDRLPSLNQIAKERRRKEAFGQHRWQIGFDDEPSVPPKKKK